MWTTMPAATGFFEPGLFLYSFHDLGRGLGPIATQTVHTAHTLIYGWGSLTDLQFIHRPAREIRECVQSQWRQYRTRTSPQQCNCSAWTSHYQQADTVPWQRHRWRCRYIPETLGAPHTVGRLSYTCFPNLGLQWARLHQQMRYVRVIVPQFETCQK